MKEFDEILDAMWGSLMDARAMAMEAVKHKMDYPELASTYYRIATDRLTHVTMLQKAASDYKDACARAENEDADEMTVVLSHDNGRIAHQVAEIKRLMEMYR